MTDLKSGRFAITPARAVEDQRLSHPAYRVLACLGTYADKDGWCFPKASTIGERIGMARSTVAGHITDLVRLGYVELHRQKRQDGSTAPSKYRLIFYRALLPVNSSEPVSDHATAGVGLPDTMFPALFEQENEKTAEKVVSAQPTGGVGPADSINVPNITKEYISVHFEKFWTIYPLRANNPKKPAKQKFEAAIKRGISPEDIIRGAQNYAALCKAENKEPKFIAQAVTFINQERWNDFQNQPAQTAGSSNPAIGTPEHAAAQERWGA